MLREALRVGGGWATIDRVVPTTEDDSRLGWVGGTRITLRFAVDPPMRHTVAFNVPRAMTSGGDRVDRSAGFDRRLARVSFPGMVYFHVSVGHEHHGYSDALSLYAYEGEFSYDAQLRYLNLPNGTHPVCFGGDNPLRGRDAREVYWNTTFGNDDPSADYESVASGGYVVLGADLDFSVKELVDAEALRYRMLPRDVVN